MFLPITNKKTMKKNNKKLAKSNSRARISASVSDILAIPIIDNTDNRIGLVQNNERKRNKRKIKSKQEIKRKRYKRKPGPIGDTELIFTMSETNKELNNLFVQLGIGPREVYREKTKRQEIADKLEKRREKRIQNKKQREQDKRDQKILEEMF